MASDARIQFLNGERVVTKAPPWHGAVTLDTMFSSLASGLFIVSALLYLIAPFQFGMVCLIGFIIAFPVEIADLVSLVADLGDARRFHHMLRVLKLRSAMSLGVWLTSIFAIFAFFAAMGAVLFFTAGRLFLLQPIRIVAAAGLPFALGVALYKGVLLSSTAQPVWSRMRFLGASLSISAGACGLTALTAVATAIGLDDAAVALRFAAGVVLAILTLAMVFDMSEVNRALAPRAGRAEIATWNAIVVYLGAATAAALCFLPRWAGWIDYIIVALTLAGALSFRHVVVIIPHRVSSA